MRFSWNGEALTLLLDDEIVDLDRPVTITINGKVVHDAIRIRRDWRFFFKNVMPRRFFMLPIVAQVHCTFDLKR